MYEQIIHSNQYISAGGNSANYPKRSFRNYGEIKYFCEISKGRFPLFPDYILYSRRKYYWWPQNA